MNDLPSTQTDASAARGDRSRGAACARVLVIDDDRLFATALERILSAEHHVTRVDSAEAALRALRAGTRFDVILCDLMMPDMTGMEFYATLQALDPEAALRIIFLTGGAFSGWARQFLQSVPNSYIEKPFDIGLLRHLVSDSLR